MNLIFKILRWMPLIGIFTALIGKAYMLGDKLYGIWMVYQFISLGFFMAILNIIGHEYRQIP